MEDLLDAGALRLKLERVVPEKNLLLAHLGDTGQPFLVAALAETALAWGVHLREHIADTTTLVQDALRDGRHILLEGAQGTLLDIDHGSYPFVTSSSPVAGGACTGGGVGPLQVSEVIGIMKAYTTRVGAGPYPTELTDEIGERIASRGHEFGTTTGRRRRVGWFDAVPIRYAVDVNSVSSIILNKLDILSGLPEIRVCVGYEIDGRRVDRWPASAEEVGRARPIYERFPGWAEEIHEARTPEDLPSNARSYVDALEDIAGVPITIVSVGPERNQTVVRSSRAAPRPGGPAVGRGPGRVAGGGPETAG
jgi:adenylosuccinate synthase